MTSSEQYCRFCDLISRDKDDQNTRFYDKVLLRSSHFAVLPGLGAQVPGYALVVSDKCYKSMAEIKLEHRPELEGILHNVMDILNSFSNGITIFEHGSVSTTSTAACLIHAHLHVVAAPIRAELWKTEASEFSSLNDFYDSEIALKSYLMIWDGKGLIYAKTHADETCQYFRRALASELDNVVEWDYLAEPYEENMRATIAGFKNYDNK